MTEPVIEKPPAQVTADLRRDGVDVARVGNLEALDYYYDDDPVEGESTFERHPTFVGK